MAYDPAALAKHLADPSLGSALAALRDELRRLDPFDPPAIEAELRRLAAAWGMKAAALIHASRVAVTGRAASPGLFEVLALLGRQTTIARLEAGERLLAARLSRP